MIHISQVMREDGGLIPYLYKIRFWLLSIFFDLYIAKNIQDFVQSDYGKNLRKEKPVWVALPRVNLSIVSGKAGVSAGRIALSLRASDLSCSQELLLQFDMVMLSRFMNVYNLESFEDILEFFSGGKWVESILVHVSGDDRFELLGLEIQRKEKKTLSNIISVALKD